MQEYSELELEVGDSILIGNQTLTLLDTEDGHALFRLELDEEFRLLTNDDVFEMLTGANEACLLPR